MMMNMASDASAQLDQDAHIARSQALHDLAERHFRALAPFLSPVRAQDHAKRLARLRPDVWTGSNDQAAFVIELAAWTADKGRSTALERYARQTALPAGSDDARVLTGLQASIISFWTVHEVHPVAGWLLRDLANEGTLWVVDASLGQYLDRVGSPCFLARLLQADSGGFWMTCGTLFAAPEALASFGLGREGEGDAVQTGSERHIALSRQSAYVAFLYAPLLSIGG
ncbi:hypothetical protein [Sphingomonas sp. Leaf20]|uniref:hypothetical protein n=1 Tax=Sphingomonas sp. Leaf20 TaxID=1735685 RepID=UPI0006FF4AF6|nr:hypothetical protein [Sphingomonas sp. Leaf20]KQM72986.1 hypothetical protein ASE72_19055 [Sphingomonas sp. Leaf20]